MKMKQLIVFGLMLLVLISVAHALVYEDGNAYLSVDPDTATLRADGIYQNVTYCNKIGNTINATSYFMFDESLLSYSVGYWNDSEYVDISPFMTYINESPTDFGFSSLKNNMYVTPQGDVNTTLCTEGLLTYQDSSDSGTWDIGIHAKDEVTRDDFYFEIDPYFNNTLYENTFTTASDWGDFNSSSSYNITYVIGTHDAYLTNTTDWNATYGELLSKAIPNVGSFRTLNCSLTYDYLTQQTLTVYASNNGGATWLIMHVAGPAATCNAVIFPTYGNVLMFNLTWQSPVPQDIHSLLLYDMNITLMDWQPPASGGTAWSTTSITTQNVTTIFMIWVGGLLLCTFLGLFFGMFMKKLSLSHLETGTGGGESRDMADWPKKVLYIVIVMAVISVVFVFIYILTPIGNMFT